MNETLEQWLARTAEARKAACRAEVRNVKAKVRQQARAESFREAVARLGSVEAALKAMKK